MNRDWFVLYKVKSKFISFVLTVKEEVLAILNPCDLGLSSHNQASNAC